MNSANERTGQGAMNERVAVSRLESDLAQGAVAHRMRRRGQESRWWWIVPTLYIIFLLLPIYWLINMSFKTNNEIVSSLTLYPHEPTLRNYRIIFTDAAWYSGYINSIIYVVMNMVISVAVALPAAYAFRATVSWATSTSSSGCSPTAWRRLPCSPCPSSSSIPPSA